jgi:hypothetical protein
VVARGKAGEVSLEHRDARHVELPRRDHAERAERGRRREMHDIRVEVAEHRLDATSRQRDRERAVARKRNGSHALHGRSRIFARAGPGGDDRRVVPTAFEVLEDAEDRIGHAVGSREEALGDDRDPHVSAL